MKPIYALPTETTQQLGFINEIYHSPERWQMRTKWIDWSIAIMIIIIIIKLTFYIKVKYNLV